MMMRNDRDQGVFRLTGADHADVVPFDNKHSCKIIEQRDCMEANTELHLYRIGLLCGSMATGDIA